MAFDRWPAHRFFRGLRQAFPVMELQTCPRGCAPSLGDQDLDRTLVLPRCVDFLHHWPLPKLWESWIFAKSPVLLELKFSLLRMCIDALESSSSGDYEAGASIVLASIGE